jgi:hypothetical protein
MDEARFGMFGGQGYATPARKRGWPILISPPFGEIRVGILICHPEGARSLRD